ncbi:MAG: L-threonylcarbamoyladenylate synthase [Spirochaetaceae bacterium]
MRTLLLDRGQTAQAGRIIRRGGLVVFPTETVYGLGANAFDGEACLRIFAAKGRPADNPLIVHIASVSMLDGVAAETEEAARRLFAAFSPGPLTVILPRASHIPDAVTAGLPTVGVRIPSHPVAQALLDAAGVPVAAPSANLSGRPSPTDFETAVEQMSGRANAVLDGGACEHGLESTIVRVEAEKVRVLREGAVTREMIAEVLWAEGQEIAVAGIEGPGGTGQEEPPSEAIAAPAPGMRHAHYQPRARVVAVESEEVPEALARILEDPRESVGYIGFQAPRGAPVERLAEIVRPADPEDYARRLYRAFYGFDAAGCTTVVAELPAPRGIGRALRDRLRRASGIG